MTKELAEKEMEKLVAKLRQVAEGFGKLDSFDAVECLFMAKQIKKFLESEVK